MPKQQSTRPGYVALLSVLIVSTVAAMTVIILFVTSLSTVFNSGDVGEGKIARAFADACAEMALQEITNQVPKGEDCDDPSNSPNANCPCYFSGSPHCWIIEWEPTAGEGSCDLVAAYMYDEIDDADATDDTRWRIRATGTGPSGDVTKYVEVDAYRSENDDVVDGDAAVVERWVECVDFTAAIGTACATE